LLKEPVRAGYSKAAKLALKFEPNRLFAV
jgi:hypothetical protein